MKFQRFAKLLPFTLFVLGLAVTYFLKEDALSYAKHELRIEFEKRANILANRVEDRLEMHKRTLRSIASFASHDQHITKKEFGDFISNLGIQKTENDILGVGLAVLIPADENSRHPEKEQKGDVRISLLFLEILSTDFDPKMLQDMYASPPMRKAMELAGDLDRPIMASSLKLTAGSLTNEPRGVMMYFPVYRHLRMHATLGERRKNIAGWMFFSLCSKHLTADILDQQGMPHLRMAMLGEHNGASPSALTGATLAESGQSAHRDPLVFERRIGDTNAPWIIQVQALPAYSNGLDYRPATTIMLSGSLISILLFLLAWNLTSRREKAEALAHEMTQGLQESEYRWKFALEGAGEGMWDWDVLRGKVIYSGRWKEILGYSQEEVSDSLDEWESRIHPDDKHDALNALHACMEGKTPAYVSEHRLKCMDGSWKWVLDRGAVANRASDGHPLRLIGSSSDVTDRRESDSRIIRLTQLYATLSHCNQAIVKCQDETSLFSAVCEIAVQHGGMAMAWIGLVNEETGKIETAASCGMTATYLAGIRVTVNPGEPSGDNPAAVAIRENRPVWGNDFLNDPTMTQWHERASRFKWGSVATLPLIRMGKTVGAFAVYSKNTNHFNAPIQAMLQEVAIDISNAMDNFVRRSKYEQEQKVLRESEARFNTLFTNNTIAMLLIDPDDGAIKDANQKASTFYGWDRATLSNMNIRDINVMFSDNIHPAMARALDRENNQFFFQHRCANGGLYDVEVFSGPVEIAGQTLLLSSVHDITQRRATEQALYESESFNAVVLNSLNEHIAVIDSDGNIIAINQAWLHFAKRNGSSGDIEYWLGINYLDICGSSIQSARYSDAALAHAGISAVIAGQQPDFQMEYSCDSVEEARWFVMHVTPLRGTQSGAVISHEDISLQKRYEIEIKESRDRLSYISNRLIEAQELERKNLARELHDELGQRFTMLNINLHQLRPSLTGSKAITVWHQAAKDILGLMNQIRAMSGFLRPPTLDHLGLEAAISQLLEDHFHNSATTYTLDYAGLPASLSSQIEITVYRFIQEGITNIVRHAAATHVMVEVNSDESRTEIEIILRDNGKGFGLTFDLNKTTRSGDNYGHFGLIGMEERVKILNGKFHIESTAGKGTRIVATIPLIHG